MKPALIYLSAALALCLPVACTAPAPIAEPPAPDSASPSVAQKNENGKEPTKTPEAAVASIPDPSWEITYAELLQKYVTAGGVRYADWKNSTGDLAKLKSVVDAIASSPATGSENERLAYYLNAYNAWILNNVLEDYPVKGVGGGNALGRNAFFAGNRIIVGGEKTSFNDLENEIVRKEFKEPRIHFALNCASAGCPPLQNRPFRGATLESDLTRLTTAFVSHNPEGVRKTPDGTYSISEIFTWFEEDFGDVPTFINRYRTEPIPEGATITSHDYDWSLNEAT